MKLVMEVQDLLAAHPAAAAITGMPPVYNFPALAGNLLGRICGNQTIGKTVGQVYRDNAILVEQSLYDIEETARRNFEPEGAAAAMLFSRGVHAVMGHRVAHQLWQNGDPVVARALAAAFGRAFSTDMHPAATIGAGFWLDHGLGFVVGETCVIDEDVSIWHNVTLGSTLTDSGPDRHPKIGRGVVIGAGATVLGNITVGAGANIAAGAVVVEDVPANTAFVGTKARNIGAAKVAFTRMEDAP